MGEARVPDWYAATGLHGENHRVYEAFQELLHNLPMSYTDLAGRVGVSQPAVSRWAMDASHPSLHEMAAAFSAVRDRMDEIQEHVEAFGHVLSLIDEAMRLHEVGPGPRSAVDSHIRSVADRLRESLGLAS
jgi:transcriptional regulator with XRE-family HTH domain